MKFNTTAVRLHCTREDRALLPADQVPDGAEWGREEADCTMPGEKSGPEKDEK